MNGCWREKILEHTHALLKTLKDEDPKKYRSFIRMDEAQFCHLLSLVEPHITRKTTNMRAPIPAGERLTVTLRYLASGRCIIIIIIILGLCSHFSPLWRNPSLDSFH